ncbi:ABC transporter permease, partial [Microbulbifer sp.]|uniref:ABC transporter permease n=1 Tax=Microbulbifer sp. TaxID=1908541 RepID=UPI002F949506
MGLGSVFLSHYRRHPGQLLGLLLILVCAAMLWSGVRSLTGSAEDAVARSRAALEPLLSVAREDGRPVDVADFARLRRAGLCASPRLEVRFAGSEAPDVIGLDPFTSACLRQYRAPEESRQARGEDSYATAVARLISTLDRPLLLGSAADYARWQQLALPGTGAFQFEQLDGLPRAQLFTDISVAADLASSGRATFAVLLPAAELEKLPLPEGYRTEVEDYGVEPDPLVDAFLLSLNTLGALTLLVAALLVRSVYRFALEQRRRSLQILVRFGVPPGKLRIALLAEVLLVAVVGGSLGLWLGGRLASAMAAGFQGTLNGLFNVDTLIQGAPTAEAWLGMVLILVLLVGWAGMDLLILRRAQWGAAAAFGQSAGSGRARNGRIVVALLLVVASLLALLATDALWLIFTATMGCLIGVGMLLPELLNSLLARAERHAHRPLLEWSCSEMRALCRLLGLPLTALAFAIATAIGVQAMVTGFESTFARWLDQRLQGDLYIDPGQLVATSEWREQLQQLPGVNAVLPMVHGRAVLETSDGKSPRGELPVDVFAVDPASPLLQQWPFLAAVQNPWAQLPTRGVLINEQLARRQSLALGDRLRFRLGGESLTREVIGIYADYGRPEGELMLPLALVPDSLPNRYSTFVLGASNLQKIHWQDWPQQYAWMADSRLRDQAGLKRAANAAFARTFQMTRMLNGLTLALAGTALALMGLVIFRLRQGSYTLLHVYG